LGQIPDGERGIWKACALRALSGESTPGFALDPDSSLGRTASVWVLPLPIYQGESKPAGVAFITMEVETEDSEEPARKAARDQDRLQLARQFAVTLNHEINNPLFIVSATLEDVLAEPLSDEIHGKLEMALDNLWQVAEAVKLLQEIRQIVSTTYIPGYTMIDLEASSHRPKAPD